MSEQVEAVEVDVSGWNIHQRWHGIMKEWSYVQKRKPAGLQYATVSHDDVARELQPLLLKYRVVAVPFVEGAEFSNDITQVWLRVDFVNIDAPAQIITTKMYGQGVDKQDKGPGKAISYAFKYCVLKSLCLVTGEDADLESLDRSAASKKAPAKTYITEKPTPPASTYKQLEGCISEGQARLIYAKRKTAAIVDDLQFKKFCQEKGWKASNEIPVAQLDAVLAYVTGA